MIATIQIGNSDNKLTQQTWSMYVDNVRVVVRMASTETFFFACSEGSQPWQNACWVVSVSDDKLDDLMKALTRTRKRFKQESVAVVLGTVQMI